MGKRVLYIEKEKFLRSMMEFALKAKGAEIHTIETLHNNLYLLEDLKPQLVIFDLETCEANLAELDELYQFASQTKLVATVKNSSTILDKRVSGLMEKPLVANTLAERVLSLVD